MSTLREAIIDIPDFPSPGVIFRDITPLLADADLLSQAVQELAGSVCHHDVDLVLAAEARGFLLGPALALQLGAGFLLARKPGKLPRETISAEYALEYGVDRIEMHRDLIKPGMRVLVHDDVLATGGTAAAMVKMVQDQGGVVAGCSFLIELDFLSGRSRLEGLPVSSLVHYAAE